MKRLLLTLAILSILTAGALSPAHAAETSAAPQLAPCAQSTPEPELTVAAAPAPPFAPEQTPARSITRPETGRIAASECIGPCFGGALCPARPFCTTVGCINKCCHYECW
jgi:hypothetical protein